MGGSGVARLRHVAVGAALADHAGESGPVDSESAESGRIAFGDPATSLGGGGLAVIVKLWRPNRRRTPPYGSVSVAQDRLGGEGGLRAAAVSAQLRAPQAFYARPMPSNAPRRRQFAAASDAPPVSEPTPMQLPVPAGRADRCRHLWSTAPAVLDCACCPRCSSVGPWLCLFTCSAAGPRRPVDDPPGST